MTMLRNYKMFTYEGGYTYPAHVRDEVYQEPTGHMVDTPTTFKDSVVARTRALADAWIEEHHNPGYLSHTNFEYRLIDEQPAPYMLIEVPY